MPVSGTTIFSDSADYQAGFRGAKINLVFTGPGVFYARVTSVRLPHLRLFSIEESLPRIAFVSLPEEWLHFAFAVAPKRTVDLGRARNAIIGFDGPQRR